MLLELPHDVRDGRLLLTDRDVDAFDARVLLVDDRIDRQRRLARLPVADDQLALPAADRHHRVDRLIAGLYRLTDGFAVDHAGRDALDRGGARGLDGALAVQRLAERIHHAAQQLRPDRHFQDAPRRLDGVALG